MFGPRINVLCTLSFMHSDKDSQGGWPISAIAFSLILAYRLDMECISILPGVMKHSSDPPRPGMSPYTSPVSSESSLALFDALTLLSTVSSKSTHENQMISAFSIVGPIRHLLTSTDPNEQYIFLSCLSYLDASTWAGCTPGSIAVFDEWEVQEIMRFLNSPDGLIRKMVSPFNP